MPARWAARVVSGVFIIFGGFMLLFYVGSQQPGRNPLPPDVVLNAVLSIPLAAGLLLAIFWKGMGEVIGGLVIIGADVGLLVALAMYGTGPVVVLILSAIVSLVFIACGWYTLAHRHPHATPLVA